jgi:hypothetical protein
MQMEAKIELMMFSIGNAYEMGKIRIIGRDTMMDTTLIITKSLDELGLRRTVNICKDKPTGAGSE